MNLPLASGQPNRHNVPRRRWPVSLLIALVTCGALHASAPAPGDSLALAGGDQILWIVSGEWNGDQRRFLNWIARMDPATLDLSPLRMQALLGRSVCSAEWHGVLYLFVAGVDSDQAKASHYSYDRSGETRRERRLPDEALPTALAGGSEALPGLWAVVDGQTAQQVQASWEEYQRSLETQPAEDPTTPPAADRLSVASRAATLSADGDFLVMYDGTRWQPGFRAPTGSPPAARVWLAISDRTCHLFWQANPKDASLRYAQRDRETWMEMPPLRFSRPVAAGCAGVMNRQLVFAALVEDERGDAVRCESIVFLPTTQSWREQPAIKSTDGKPLLLPKGSRVAVFRDMLALLRPSQAGAEVGLWSAAAGQPVLPFAPVPVYKTQESATRSNQLREMISLVVAGGIVLLVYWRRRDHINLPAALPRGLVVADLGRRGLAAVIDMLPAGLIVGAVWHAPLSEYYDAWWASYASRDSAPPTGDPLLWASICFALIYGGWCAAFELLWSASPGKRLLRCAVVTESAEKPTPFQIATRHAARVVELFPLLQYWPFLLLLFMTRNRQRLGDLLAHTIVVEHVAVTDTDKPDDE